MELINKEKLIQSIEECHDYGHELMTSHEAVLCRVGLLKALDCVKKAPTCTRPHGVWKPDGDDYYWCSECEYLVKTTPSLIKESLNYCPKCGAKMDGAKDDV